MIVRYTAIRDMAPNSNLAVRGCSRPLGALI